MKQICCGHRSFLCLLALAAMIVTASAADSAERSTRIAYRVVNNDRVTFDRVRHGMNKFDVYVALGAPTARLSPDVWVYTRCRLLDDPEGRSPFDTMVLEFAKDRLVRLKLVEGKALQAAIATLSTPPSGETVAAQK